MFQGRLLKIVKLWPSKRQDILPTGTFIMYNPKQKITVSGWLPCHDNSVQYHLKLTQPLAKLPEGPQKILQIEHMAISKKKAKKIQIQTNLTYDYERIAKYAQTSMAVWTLATVYTYFEMPNNIEEAFLKLVEDFTRICTRGHDLALGRLIYDPEQCYTVINRGLCQMGELPTARTWPYLKDMLAWQEKTRWDTASRQICNLARIQKYKNVWADTCDIQMARAIGQYFVPQNTKIIQGEPCPSVIPKNAVILFRSLEDVCKWKCSVDWGKLRIRQRQTADQRQTAEQTRLLYKKLGISDVQNIEGRYEHDYIAYAHLWSVSEWKELIDYDIGTFTFIGRTDQYPKGRGQVFRDMCTAHKFNIEYTVHDGAEAVMSAELSDIEDICKRHGVVQCFGDRNIDIDTGRRQLSHPYRIRTLRPSQTKLLYEEKSAPPFMKNASCISIKSFHGLNPNACVYICSKETTSFEIHAARTMARDALYIIGAAPCMFSFDRKPPNRTTISPFT